VPARPGALRERLDEARERPARRPVDVGRAPRRSVDALVADCLAA